MTFVDHDVAQAAQENRPPRMVPKKRQVNHVRVGEQPARALPREATNLGRGVTVVGTRCDITQARYRCRQLVGRPELVMTERLRRGEVEDPGPGVTCQGIHDRQLKCQ
jgi:hypothetical protein